MAEESSGGGVPEAVASPLGEAGAVDERRVYEIGYLLVPSIVESDVPGEVTALHDLLDKEGVGLISEEFPKFRTLAYEMRKHVGGAWENYGNGYFGWMKFEGKGEQAKHIDEELRRVPNLLRYLIVKSIREHTLVGARPPRQNGPRVKREAPADAPQSAPVSEAELDKSIEKLIAD